jgi:hypothetical protein
LERSGPVVTEILSGICLERLRNYSKGLLSLLMSRIRVESFMAMPFYFVNTLSLEFKANILSVSLISCVLSVGPPPPHEGPGKGEA